MRDESLFAALPVDVVRAEDGEPLRLERDIELVGCHDHRVLPERIRSEPLLEHREHAWERTEVRAHRSIEQAREEHGAVDAVEGEPSPRITPDLHREQVARGGLPLLVDPHALATHYAMFDEVAVADDGVRGIRLESNAIARLV